MNREERLEQLRNASILGVAAWKLISKEQLPKRNSEKLEEYYRNPNLCKYCGKIIEPAVTKNGRINVYDAKRQKFCDYSCAASYNNAIRYVNPKKKIKYPPHNCENPECKNITKNPRFCSSKCGGKFKALEKIQRFLKGELKDNTVRDKTIRDYLIEKQGGVCNICKNPPTWNSKPIVFIVDHVDGNYENNSPDNLRAICPNCNSQTDSFGGRNNFKRDHVIKRPKANPNRK